MSNTRKTSRRLPNYWWEDGHPGSGVSIIVEVPLEEFGFAFLLFQCFETGRPYRRVCSQTGNAYPSKLASKAWNRYGFLAERILSGELPQPRQAKVFWGNREMLKGCLSHNALLLLNLTTERGLP